MFRRILVPVDLTEKSLAAVDLAYAFARQSKAEVVLLHVIETIEHIQFDELKPFYGRLEASARSGLRDFSERFRTTFQSIRWWSTAIGHNRLSTMQSRTAQI
jgi:nucleotide-binding universal stress UspA family protein